MVPTTIKKAVHLLRTGETTPTELLEKCFSLLRRSRHLNAFITLTEDDAIRRASESSKRFQSGKPLSALDGIPIAVKDNYCTSGVATTCASHMLRSYKAPYTATVVQRLLNKGAVIVGKTNMDEFAMGCAAVDSVFGPVKNPWPNIEAIKNSDDFYIAGGSSGGSAVSVGTGSALGALASDTGGSTRNPAALCGVVGVKPTYGLLSRHGLIPLVNSMDVPGIHSLCVDDAVLLLEAMIGHDPLDSTSVDNESMGAFVDSTKFLHESSISVCGLRVGVPQEYHTPGMAKDVVDTWQRVADVLDNGGAKVERVSLPHTKYSVACYAVLNNCEIASNFARYDGIEYGYRAKIEESTEALYGAGRHEAFNDTVRGRILAGNYFLLRRNYEKYFIHALKIRRLIAQDFQNLFAKGIEVLLSPVTIGTAPLYSDFTKKDEREQTTLQDVCTQPANMAGIPAVSIPVGLSAEALPIGLQIMGPLFSDVRILKVCKWLEQEVKFSNAKLFHKITDEQNNNVQDVKQKS